MNFIAWCKENQLQIAKALAKACAKEPKSFDDFDGRFYKDKFHIYSLMREFPDIFKREENNRSDLIYLPENNSISLKSQTTIFQYPGKTKPLYSPRDVIIVNSNSTYGNSDPAVIKQSLMDKVDYWLFYHKQTQEHSFTFGVTSGLFVANRIKISGSQFKVKIYNHEFEILFNLDYTETYDRIMQDNLYKNLQNAMFEALLN